MPPARISPTSRRILPAAAILISFYAIALFAAPSSSASLPENEQIPPWIADPANPTYRGGSTGFQAWDFRQSLFNPIVEENPFGFPILTSRAVVGLISTTGPDPEDNDVQAWTTTSIPGGFFFSIPHDPSQADFVELYIRYTSTKPLLSDGINGPASLTITQFDPDPVIPRANGYTQRTLSLRFEPNPVFTQFEIFFPNNTRIAQLDIFSIAVPEPSALVLFLPVVAIAASRRRASQRAARQTRIPTP